MKTEEQARKCWCPFVRISYFEGEDVTPAHNRAASIDKGIELNVVPFRCIASECMAWRWEDGFDPSALSAEEKAESIGYCGLAGTP